MNETLKQYLIRIGWDVNRMGFNNLVGLLDNLKRRIVNSNNYMASMIAKSSLLMVGAIAGVTKATWELAESVAESDLATERLARKLWTTEQNARSLSTSLDVLGMSYEDLFYATPEQYNRFLQLNSLGKTLEAPEELDKTLVKIRDIQYEFSKMRMIAQYGTRWVVYFLGQMLGGDVDKIHTKLKNLNDLLIEKIPVMAEKIAKVLSVVIRFAKALVQFIEAIGTTATRAFDAMGSSGVRALGLLAGAFAVIASGPLGWILTALAAIVLLLDDFFTWKRGGISYLDWSGFAEIFDEIGYKVEGASEKFGDLAEKFGALMDKIHAKEGAMLLLEEFLDLVETGLDGINVALDLLNGALDILNGNWENLKNNGLFSDVQELFDGLSNNSLVGGLFSIAGGPTTGVSLGGFGGGNSAQDWAYKILQSMSDGDQVAATSTTGVGGGRETTNNTTINQTNNIQTSETASEVEDATKKAILMARKWTDSVI